MFGDITKRVILAYKADTASAAADIKKLALTQKEHAQVMKKDLEAQNATLEAQISKYGKMAATAAAVYGGIKVALDSMEFYYERNEQREKASGHSIERLKEATRGLVSESDLLKLAVTANNGVMKASQEELITVAKAMDVFADRNYDAAKVTQDFNEFLQTGKAKALKDYGLQITETRGSVEQFKEVMSQLNKVAKEQDAIVNDSRDAWDQSKVGLKDQVDKVRETFGKMVAEMQPAISGFIKGLEMAMEGWRLIFDGMKEGWEWLQSKMPDILVTEERILALKASIKEKTDEIAASEQQILDIRKMQDAQLSAQESKIALLYVKLMSDEWQARMVTVGKFLGNGMAVGMQQGMAGFLDKLGISAGRIDLTEADMAEVQADADARRKKGRGGKAKADLRGTVETPLLDKLMREMAVWDEWKAEFVEDLNVRASISAANAVALSSQAQIVEVRKSAAELSEEYAQFHSDQSQSVLRSMFGDPAEMNLYASGLDMLKESGVAAFQAMMTGSESAGAAFKKMLASNMMGLASEMFGKSIYHGAMALGSLAMLDGRGAAMHGAAAGKYAAGAVLLGGIAASMGAGAGASASVSGGAGSSAPATASAGIAAPAGSSGNSVTVVVGDDFADDSPRKRQQRAERMVQMGLRSSREVVFA